MRINRLDLNQLACLNALLVHRNVSRAASEVHVSQPAASATLARLREYFGDPLLVPSGRTMSLTPFARTLVKPVGDLLLQAQALTRRRPEVDPSRIERDITLVGSDYVVSVLLAKLFARAEQQAPGLRFETRSIGGYLAEELDQGDIDLVVSLQSAISKEHPSEPLFTDRYACIAWSQHPSIGDALTVDQYLQLGHASTVLGRGRVSTVDQQALHELGLQRRVEVRVPSFTLLPPCLVNTSRIATVQYQLARVLARQWPLKILPCPIDLPSLTFAVQWHRYQSEDPAIRWVCGVLRELVKGEGLDSPA